MKQQATARPRTLMRMGAVLVSMAMAATVFSASAISTNAATVTQSRVSQLEEMFTTLDLMDITIPELQQALEEGRVTSEELVQMYLDRIEAYDDDLDLNSIISINPDALETARQLDEERAAGNVRGPLHGVPIIIKDNYDLEDMATTAGAGALEDSIAPDDATVVERLEEAGAIVIAKANLSEFAFSGANSRSYVGGTVHNAYDTSRTAAGSSGGTAVSITSNFAVAGLGTDTGSSIRRPSSFSNLYGLRPSKGLTSIDGVVPLNADQDVTGPMCRTVEDLAIMLDAMAGTDEADRYTVEADADSLIPEGGYTSYLNADGLEGKRIAYITNSFGYYVSTSYDSTTGEWVSTELDNPVELSDDVQELVEQTLSVLEAGGAELVDFSEILTEELIFELNGAVSSASLSGSSVFEWDMYEYFLTLGDNATMHSVADIIEDGRYVSDLSYYTTATEDLVNPRFDEDGNATEEYEANWEARLNFRNTISELLEEYDIDAVIYVSQTDVASLEEESDYNTNNNGASYMNKFGPVAGLPEMMIPMGFVEASEENGLTSDMPLGISMFSSYGNEATLIEIAYGYEQTAGDSIRQQPELLPALEDEELNLFLSDLVLEGAALTAVDYTETSYEAVSLALATAELVDTSDVSATYQAAYDLASALDALVPVSEDSSDAADADDATGADDTTDTVDADTGVTEVEDAATETVAEETKTEDDVPVTGDSPQDYVLAGTTAGVSALLLISAAIWRLYKRRRN